MKFVSDKQLVPGQTYMIYYPKPDTHSNYGSQYLVGIFTGSSFDGALIFNVNGSFVSNLAYANNKLTRINFTKFDQNLMLNSKGRILRNGFPRNGFPC
jgi:hypothetical protein